MIATVTLNPSLDEWIELPRLRPGTLNRASGFARYPGGKGINVSRVIEALGGHTVAFTVIGGQDGAIFRSLLGRLGVPCRFLDVPGSTRNNYKILTGRPRLLTEINTAGPRLSRTALRQLQRQVLRLRPPARCVVLSGSLPPGVASQTYQHWIATLRQRAIPCVLDASGAALRYGLRARPWLTKPNRQEAEEWLGRRLTRMRHYVQAVRALLRHAHLVILSLGAEGALLGCAATRPLWFARPPAVHVESSVGAGDSLVGGFLAAWATRASALDAFRLGVASGTATAMTPGTQLCHRADVLRVLRRVSLQRAA